MQVRDVGVAVEIMQSKRPTSWSACWLQGRQPPGRVCTVALEVAYPRYSNNYSLHCAEFLAYLMYILWHGRNFDSV